MRSTRVQRTAILLLLGVSLCLLPPVSAETAGEVVLDSVTTDQSDVNVVLTNTADTEKGVLIAVTAEVGGGVETQFRVVYTNAASTSSWSLNFSRKVKSIVSAIIDGQEPM